MATGSRSLPRSLRSWVVASTVQANYSASSVPPICSRADLGALAFALAGQVLAKHQSRGSPGAVSSAGMLYL